MCMLIALSSCAQKQLKYKPDPVAVQLNNQAMKLINYSENIDSANKALSLLDQATSIDSNNFIAYFNKLMFYFPMKRYDKLISINNKLLQLRPNAHDLYMTGGIFYEIVGDTISSKKYFNRSLTICNSVLDTMGPDNRDFAMLTINKAINLIMLDDKKAADKLLGNFYDHCGDKESDVIKRDDIELLMAKNKNDIINVYKYHEKENGDSLISESKPIAE